MGRTTTVILGAAALLGACATPGIDYQARIMPNAPQAAELRDIEVHRFEGPSGGWFARRLEAVLASAQFDGQYWFNVSDPDYSPHAPSGIYTGFVDVTDVQEHHSENYETRCVKRDKDTDECLRTKEFVEYCISTKLWVEAHVELIDPRLNEVVFSGAYPGSASDYACEEYRAHYDNYGLRDAILSIAGSAIGFNDIGHGRPGGLVREALADTLGPIRRDVAPRNATVRAKFVTKAVDPVVKADPRFNDAIKLAKNNPQASCNVWALLAETYPAAPSVTHNLGACSEASGNYGEAQRLYAAANDFAGRSPEAAEIYKRLTSSLSQIDKRRSDLVSLEQLTGAPQPGLPES